MSQWEPAAATTPPRNSNSRGGQASTQDIIKLVQKQKHTHEKLSRDPIFNQYCSEIKAKELKLRRKGWRDAPKPQIDEELDAEAHARMQGLLTSAAKELAVLPRGVWARFGKPYRPVGDICPTTSTVPNLYRHRMKDAEDSDDSDAPMKKRRPAKKQKASTGGKAPKLQSDRELTEEEKKETRLLRHKAHMQFSLTDRLETKFPTAPVSSAARRICASKIKTPWLNAEVAKNDSTSNDQYGVIPAPLPPSQQVVEAIKSQIKRRLVATDSDLQVSRQSRITAMSDPLLGRSPATELDLSVFERASARSVSSTLHRSPTAQTQRARKPQRTRTARFNDDVQVVDIPQNARGPSGSSNSGHEAVTDREDASDEDCCSEPDSPFMSRAPSESGAAPSTSRPPSMQRKVLHRFLTKTRQTVTLRADSFKVEQHIAAPHIPGEAVQLVPGHTLVQYSDPSERKLIPSRSAMHRQADDIDNLSVVVSESGIAEGGEPEWQMLTDLVQIPKGQERNKVYKWHNDFVKIRHRGRQQLQELLWQRLQGRTKTRTTASMAFGLYNSVMSEMEYTLGHRTTCAVSGIAPRDPFDRAALFCDQKQEGPLRKNAATLQLEDVQLLERFYNQLCLLVEAQKASDPMSLLIVQITKELLESGHTLHSPLLAALIQKFSIFLKSAGLKKYNYFLLPIFTFVRKCCGVSQADLEKLLTHYGIDCVVYAPPDAPRRPITPLTPASRPSSVRSDCKFPVSPYGDRPGSNQRRSMNATRGGKGGSRPESRAGLPQRPSSGAVAQSVMDNAAAQALVDTQAAVERVSGSSSHQSEAPPDARQVPSLALEQVKPVILEEINVLASDETGPRAGSLMKPRTSSNTRSMAPDAITELGPIEA